MITLLTLLAMCLFMVFGYPMIPSVNKSLVELSVIMGFWGGVITFLVIIIVAYQDVISIIDERDRRSNFMWGPGKDDNDYVDAEYEEETP